MLRLCAALCVAAAPVAAQQGFALTPPTDPSARTLTVTGEGSAEAPADVALIRFVVRTEGDTPEQALQRHEAEVARVSGLLADAGVPDSSVVLDQLSIGPGGMDDEMMEDAFGGSGGEGLVVSRMVSVRTADLAAVPTLVARLASDDSDPLAVQSRQIDVQYVVGDTAPLRERALRAAMRNARQRAVLMAEGADVRLGRVLSVTEGGVTAALIAGGSASVPSFPGMGMFARSGAATEVAAVIVVFAVE